MKINLRFKIHNFCKYTQRADWKSYKSKDVVVGREQISLHVCLLVWCWWSSRVCCLRVMAWNQTRLSGRWRDWQATDSEQLAMTHKSFIRKITTSLENFQYFSKLLILRIFVEIKFKSRMVRTIRSFILIWLF